MTAAAKAGMSEPTARKYIRLSKLPSETKKPQTWRTRQDPFADVWEQVKTFLKVNPSLEVKALFGELQRRHPGKFQPGQLRTLQRRVKRAPSPAPCSPLPLARPLPSHRLSPPACTRLDCRCLPAPETGAAFQHTQDRIAADLR